MIERDFESAVGRRYDVAVVGGGIYGIATALEAARRGLRPILIERGDFGGGTSWNSLRILHGGLRYLQTLDLTRFRESVRERRWYCWHFPEWIRPLPCVMPLYGRGLKRHSAMSSALWLNDRLSRHRNQGVVPSLHLAGGSLLSAEQTAEWFPQVPRPGLQGGALWHDAVMVNSQRVVMEMLRWACHCGATALNYVAAEELRVEAGRVRGVVACDAVSGKRAAIAAGAVINCSGPWGREVAARFGGGDMTALFRPSLAFNVLLNRPAMAKAALAVQAPASGSPTLFVQPWRGRMLAGTMHLPWTAATVDKPRPSSAQVQAFLDQLNAAVPGLALTAADVSRVYAGLLPAEREGMSTLASRPVIHDHAADPGGPRGLVSVSGVKFTTARDVAERALRQAWAVHDELPEYQLGTHRPKTHRGLDLTNPEQLLRGDAAYTCQEVMRIVREEAVVQRDDLLMRRTDWAGEGRDQSAVAERVDELLRDSRLLHQGGPTAPTAPSARDVTPRQGPWPGNAR